LLVIAAASATRKGNSYDEVTFGKPELIAQLRNSPQLLGQSTPPRKHQDGILCDFCLNWVAESGNVVFDKSAEIGTAIGCTEACSPLEEDDGSVGGNWQYDSCALLCEAVGVQTFIKYVEIQEPNPIYACQLWNFCAAVPGGLALIDLATSYPAVGPQGTLFSLRLEYTVYHNTSIGTLQMRVLTPYHANEFTEHQIIHGQPPGKYGKTWIFDTHPSLRDPMAAGIYRVKMAICAGFCDQDIHNWAGIYASRDFTFSVVDSNQPPAGLQYPLVRESQN